jgi:acyl-coenzyme A thioesterase PaaI-like protein
MRDVARKLTSPEEPLCDRSPCNGWLGHRVASLAHQRREITVGIGMLRDRRPDRRRFRGGPIAACSDIAGDFAIGMSVDGGVAIARLRRRSRTPDLVDIEAVDNKEELVALGRGTYAHTPA